MTGLMIEALAIPDVKLITPRIFRDERGFFSETYNAAALASQDFRYTFVQDNHSLSRAVGVLRGLHYQIYPKAQGKLVRVVRGAIFDVAVDLRVGSPTYGHNVSALLSAMNWAQLYIPVGFAHGFCTMEPDTEVIYKVTEIYAPEYERGVLWNDPALAIDWPLPPSGPVVSEKDRTNPRLAELPPQFRYEH